MYDEKLKLNVMCEEPLTPLEQSYIDVALNLQKTKRRGSFVELLSKKPFPNSSELVAVEIGTFKGVNAYYMLKDCPQLTLYCVDGYKRVTIETGGADVPEYERLTIMACAENLLSPFYPRCVRVFKQSEEAYKDFPDEYFDYVYIDGEHLYDFVKKDIELWYPKLKKNGIFAGHDFEMAEVMRAVAEFRYNHKYLNFYFSTGNGESDWWFVKT